MPLRGSSRKSTRGAVDEGGGQGHLLPHPLRVVHDELAALVGEEQELEQLLGAPPRLVAREAVHAAREVQVLLAGEALVERQLLGQDADERA